MDQVLQGIPHCICYLDDILVTGCSDAEHMANLDEVLRCLQWTEAYFMHSTTTTKTISILCDIFARYGLQRQIVTDNRPQFISKEFWIFMSANVMKSTKVQTLGTI